MLNQENHLSVIKIIGKYMSIICILFLCVLLLAACGEQNDIEGESDPSVSNESVQGEEPSGEAPSGEEPSGIIFTDAPVTEENIHDFVTLGQYLGMTYERVTAEPVTDRDIDEFIEFHLSHGDIPLSDLTDDFVREHFELGSVDEYRAAIKEQMETNRLEEAQNDERRQVWNQVMQNSVFHMIPNTEVEQRSSMAMMQFYYYALMYNIDIEEFMLQITQGVSYEDFLEFEIRPGAVADVMMDLVVRAIAVREGIAITAAEFDAAILGFVEQYGYESVDHFMQFNDETTVSVALLADKVIDVLMQSAIMQ